jgi:inorganic triphosphatase YgiF
MRELELKFALPLALQDSRARRGADHDRRERVWSCYYDTPDGALARARTAVRVRRHGERWLQTVKAEGDDRFERFEWERAIAGPSPERDALPPDTTPHGALAQRTFGQWRALFETDFERVARRLEPAPGLVIEIARDLGELRCGERREPIREVELECLEGSRETFFTWALEWARSEGACLLWPSKHERGLRLAARLPLAPAPVKQASVAPPAELSASDAAASAVRGCLAHACANVEPILASDAPEGPHQFRVALRRLRAAIRYFDLRAGGDADAWTAIDEDASALADAAGRVRDVDVFESGLLRTLRERFAGDAALETLTRALDDARDDARRELRRTLAGPALTAFVLRTLIAAERAGHGGLAPIRHDAFAVSRLHALRRRVVRRAARAADEPGWHRTRIAVKNLRYALDFASAALPRGVDGPRAIALLAAWQETLGAGQDLAVARDVAAGALARPGVPVDAAVRATALIDGWRAFAAPAATAPGRGARRTLRALGDALRGLRPAAESGSAPPRSDAAGMTDVPSRRAAADAFAGTESPDDPAFGAESPADVPLGLDSQADMRPDRGSPADAAAGRGSQADAARDRAPSDDPGPPAPAPASVAPGPGARAIR